jgi:hypothetical protein
MTPADQYRVKAGDMTALARAETDPFQKAEYERLSLAYLRLANQAERNSQNDVVWYDPLIDRPTKQPQAQQQQQAQSNTGPKSGGNSRSG